MTRACREVEYHRVGRVVHDYTADLDGTPRGRRPTNWPHRKGEAGRATHDLDRPRIRRDDKDWPIHRLSQRGLVLAGPLQEEKRLGTDGRWNGRPGLPAPDGGVPLTHGLPRGSTGDPTNDTDRLASRGSPDAILNRGQDARRILVREGLMSEHAIDSCDNDDVAHRERPGARLRDLDCGARPGCDQDDADRHDRHGSPRPT